MFYLLYVAWLFKSACSDGYFTDNNGECAYYSYETNTYTTDYTQLTFREIADTCYDTIQPALKLGYCSNGKNDLVYPVYDTNLYNNCCPYCKCDTRDDIGSIREFERPVRKECYSCTCDTVPGTTELGYTCDRLFSVDEIYNFDAFQCPAASTCTDAIGSTTGNTYYPGQGYFKNKDANEMCTTYCYCNGDGTETCATDFANILASTNKGLQGTFLDQNSYGMRDCIDEPSRIFTMDSGPDCQDYPSLKCSCPTGKVVGDTWYSEYPDEDDGFTSIGCAKCECKDGSNYGGNDYVECDSIGGFRTSGQCTQQNIKEITCHEAYGDDGCSSNDSSCRAKTITGQTVNSYDCVTTEPEAYCSWDFEQETDDSDDWDWGCGDLICGAYSDTYENQCFYYEYSVTYTDCDGVEKTESRKQYEYCCKTNNCNFQSIDTSNCVENTGFSAIMQELFECTAASNMIDDDCEDYEYVEITCSSIKELYREQAACYCGAYAGLYQDAATLWKPWIRDQIEMMFESFSRWNVALGCNIEIECDLEAQGGGISGADCNESGGECDSGYLCLSDGSCEAEIVVIPGNPCTSDSECGTSRKCETTGGFCYFSQCDNNGGCTQEYGATSECVRTTETYEQVSYTTGSCQGTPQNPRGVGVKSYGIFVAIVVAFGITLWI